ncbi:MAG: DUF4114 domain-containing protein [Cyanobacteria bacterium P01_C01_bin.38]
MVDNKKKVVSGVVAATALTGAFVAPATAQAANNDAPNSNQQQTNKEESSANLATQKVNSTRKNLNNLQAEADKAINTATNLKNIAKKKLDVAQTSEKTAKKDWERNFDKATNNAQKADEALQQGKERKAARLRKKAEEFTAQAEENRQDYEAAKLQVSQKEDNLQKATENLLSVTTEQNRIVEAAQADYDKALMQQQRVIQGATNSRKDDNWGNWTKQHTIEDRLKDSEFLALIPQFQELVQEESLAIGAQEVEAKRLDANKLFLKHDHNMRVWFINEGAGYKNQLAYEATKGDNYQKGMIFDDVSCTTDCQLSNGKNAPLDIGDFVDLGLIEGGTQLNFLLKADGARGAKTSNGDIYSADESLNSDGLQHLMAFEVNAGGRDYLMMGFEDLRGGGDLDYNDAVFVVDFGKGNLTNNSNFAQAAKVPEASNIAAIFGVTGAGLMLRRRRRKKK